MLVFGGEPIIAGDQWDSELYILYTSKSINRILFIDNHSCT